MTLELNGTDISAYVDEPGYTIQRRYTKLGPDVKTLDGVIHPGREKELDDLTVPIVGVSSEEYSYLFSLITRPTVSVTYKDPQHGVKTISCMTRDNSTSLLMDGIENKDWWDGLILEFEDCGV